MQRNRKREPLQIGTIAKSLLACAAIAACGLGYVWQKTQIYRLGDEIRGRETALVAAQKRNTMLAAQLAQLKSPATLEARCQQYNLGLVAPRENQMVRLLEPGPAWDAQFVNAAQQQLPAAPPQPRPQQQRPPPGSAPRQVMVQR